jgi:hopanoid biosynthesis associated protein HpnK
MRGGGERSSALASSGWKTQDAKAARVLKQLILTADDFGRTPEINSAIERAHRAGFLTQASLMVNEAAVAQAVEIAQRNPGLRVGLHLTLCDGRAAQLSALTDAHGCFVTSPARAGLRYYFESKLAFDLRREIRAQFECFRALGFAPTHWDGHAHLHLHPTILALAVPIAADHGFRFTRLILEPGPPTLLPTIFHLLSRAAQPLLKKYRVAFPDHVFGLRDTGRMTTGRLAALLQKLPAGVSELYFHPGAEPEEPDYATLVPLLAAHGITLPPPPTAP